MPSRSSDSLERVDTRKSRIHTCFPPRCPPCPDASHQISFRGEGKKTTKGKEIPNTHMLSMLSKLHLHLLCICKSEDCRCSKCKVGCGKSMFFSVGLMLLHLDGTMHQISLEWAKQLIKQCSGSDKACVGQYCSRLGHFYWINDNSDGVVMALIEQLCGV